MVVFSQKPSENVFEKIWDKNVIAHFSKEVRDKGHKIKVSTSFNIICEKSNRLLLELRIQDFPQCYICLSISKILSSDNLDSYQRFCLAWQIDNV